MSTNQEFLQSLYDAFNKREIETIISLMRPDVKWANGLEGGFVYGRDAVREYWISQFQNIQPELETLNFETDASGRHIVSVHQVVKDLQGNVLADMMVRQIFTIEGGLISRYEIDETETIQAMIEKTALTEAVREAYAALNRGDIDGFVKDFDPQIVRVEFDGSPAGGTYRGIEAVTAHVTQGRSTWTEGACEPERFIVAGDKVVVPCHVRVRLKDDTDWLEGRTADVFKFRNGKVIQFRTFADEHEALEWAGADINK